MVSSHPECRYLVVGAGLSGAVVARQLAENTLQRVLVAERRPVAGGNCADYRCQGITVHRYGPHVFHTNSTRVWDYLSRFTAWHPFFYRVKALIDGQEVTLPFNLDSLRQCFPPRLAARYERCLIRTFGYGTRLTIGRLLEQGGRELGELAEFIYRRVFLGYTRKQWGLSLDELDITVSSRVPVLVSRDSRYFQDRFSAIPRQGYSALIARLLNHERIVLQTGADGRALAADPRFERVYCSGAIDEFFGCCYGALPYRSLDLRYETLDVQYYQSCAQLNYPNDYAFTRCVEYKYFLSETSDKTVISHEYPMPYVPGRNSRFYPVENEASRALYERYAQEARCRERLIFMGRLGTFRYLNMDQVVEQALEIAERTLAGEL